MKNQDLDNVSLAERVQRKQELFRELAEIARLLSEQAPGLVHTHEDLNAMREERMNELMSNMRG